MFSPNLKTLSSPPREPICTTINNKYKVNTDLTFPLFIFHQNKEPKHSSRQQQTAADNSRQQRTTAATAALPNKPIQQQ
jgi:hypothetical protein